MDIITTYEGFYKKLAMYLENDLEMSVKQIYSLFPDTNKKTISWRLYELVQQGKLHRSGHGYYSMFKLDTHNSLGYDYMQKTSQVLFDILTEYGYDFYLTGLDSLVGEVLHIPETYTALIVIEEKGISEVQEILQEKELIAFTEKDHRTIEKSGIRYKADVIIIKGSDFSLADEHIAIKEKGFIDLYYAVTRMEYEISIPELSRIYQSLLRKQSISKMQMKNAAKDRGIILEINWLIESNRFPKKVRDFMNYHSQEEE